jgi:hypothetical protein
MNGCNNLSKECLTLKNRLKKHEGLKRPRTSNKPSALCLLLCYAQDLRTDATSGRGTIYRAPTNSDLEENLRKS